MKRTINYVNGDIPDRLIEYIADVQSPDGISTVAKAHVSRFGYQVKWWDVATDRQTMDEPGLDAAIRQLTEQMSRTGNQLVNGRYTENAGVDFTDEELNEYTSFVPGESEQKEFMARYYDLVAAVSTMPWFKYTVVSDGIRLANIDGLNGRHTNLLFFPQDTSCIMVPASLKFPYNVTLREQCTVKVNKYISIDEAKKEGETDADCIDRIARKIVSDFKEKSDYVDGLIAERDGKVEEYSRLIKTYAELCMTAIASRLSIAQYSILLHDICVAYRKLVPGEPIDCFNQLHLFRALVRIFTKPETKGKLDGNRVAFEVDLTHLDYYHDMMATHGFPDGCQSIIDGIDRDSREISLVLTWGSEDSIFKLVGISDPAKSPYVE